jgi:cell division control protein 24
MEPLSITTSIAGLLKASDTVLARLDPILKSRRGAEKIISPLHSELVGSKAVLAALQVLTQAVGSSRPQRLRMVAVDDLLAILTAGVLTFSELEAGISALAISEGETGVAATIQWLWRKREFEIFLSRVISFKESIRLLVTILIG